MTLIKKRNSIILIGLALLLITGAANASHFRFGHFTFQARPDISPTTADFKMIVAFRSSYFGHPEVGTTFRPRAFYLGDGRSIRYRYEVIARNLQEDWIIGRAIQTGLDNGFVRHTYRSPNRSGRPWIASYSSCCKIGELINASDAHWKVNTSIDLSEGNSSPFSNLPPIVSCPKGNCTFRVPAVDPDGDKITWRLASRGESFIPYIPSGISIERDTGIVNWSGSEAFTKGLYSVQVIIEDRDEADKVKSSAAIDFIVNLQEQVTNQSPEFDFPPTPENGSVIRAIIGQPLEIVIQATDGDPNDSVFINNAGLPDGASFEQTITGGTTGAGTFTWSPETEDLGQHIVTFIANDNRGGASTPISITLDVIKPVISSVRVVSTISTKDIQIDSESYSLPPSEVTIDGEKTIVTWEFPTFDIGQFETLSSTLRLQNVKSGEIRQVTEKLELFYNDINGDPIYELLGEQSVKVSPSMTNVIVNTDQTQYLPGEIITVGTIVENISDVVIDSAVQIRILDNQQNLVADLGTFEQPDIPPKSSENLPDVTFDTNGIYAGAYEVVVNVLEGEEVVNKFAVPFAITTENGDFISVDAFVSTDKPKYLAWGQVNISLRVMNLSQNSALSSGTGELSVFRPQGELLFRENFDLNTLVPLSNSSREKALALVDREGGEYLVKWNIYQHGALIASSQASFNIERSELHSLVGSVSVEEYETGEAKACNFRTFNRSTHYPVSATLMYQLIDLSDGKLIYEFNESEVTLTNEIEHPYKIFLGDPPDYGEYGCILSAEIEGESLQLGQAGFEVTPPKLAINHGQANRGKLLVLLDEEVFSGPHDVVSSDLQHVYLNQLLSNEQWHYTLVDNASDFKTEFYSGLYNAIVILAEEVTLEPDVQNLLVEAQYSGTGVLISGGWNRRNNKIEDGIGVLLNGMNDGALTLSVSEELTGINQGAVIAKGMVMEHCNAESWARFNEGRLANNGCHSSTEPQAVSAGTYGKGKNVYFAYDVLDMATSEKGIHETLLLLALNHIQPDEWTVGRGRVIPVEFTVTNLSRKAAVDVEFVLPQGKNIVASDLPLRGKESGWLWQYDFSSTGKVVNQLYVQLPRDIGGEVNLSVDVNAGINRSLIIDNQDLMITIADLPIDYPDTRSFSLVQELMQTNAGEARYDLVLRKLESALSDINKNKIEKAIRSLLQASDEIAKDTSVQAHEARLALGNWLFLLQQKVVRR